MPTPPTDVDTVRHLGAIVDLGHLAQSARDRNAQMVAALYAGSESLATLAELVDTHGRSADTIAALDRIAEAVLALSTAADLIGPDPEARP